jgi:hypothetical protein
MYCIKCGTQLPDEAAFCWKCGQPTTPTPNVAVAPAAITYDRCEIAYDYSSDGYYSNYLHYVANVTDQKGVYILMVSEPWEGGDNMSVPNPKDHPNLGGRAHPNLVNRLIQLGWEVTGSSDYWYRTVLRRPANTGAPIVETCSISNMLVKSGWHTFRRWAANASGPEGDYNAGYSSIFSKDRKGRDYYKYFLSVLTGNRWEPTGVGKNWWESTFQRTR